MARTYAVVVSYPTTDRYYRGERAFVVTAQDEPSARRAALAQSTQGSTVKRIRERA